MSEKKFIAEEMEQENGRQDKEYAGGAFTAFDAEYHSMVCSSCSCLCDDVSYYLLQGELVRTLNLCEVALKRLRGGILAHGEEQTSLMAPPDKDSLQKAASIIKANRPCIILGAENLGEAGIRAAINAARNCQGAVAPRMYPALRRFYETAKSHGWAAALLDEIRDQAEMVIFWRCDPLDTHHRHLSRYSLFARGRYTERGHSERTCVAVAAEKKIIEPLCQQYFQFEPHLDVSFIQALQTPPQAPPPENRDFPFFVNALQRSFYISVFFDPEAMTEAALQELFSWAASINREGKKRMVLMPLWAGGANLSGFSRICQEELSRPWIADFTVGGLFSGEGEDNDGWRPAAKAGCVIEIINEAEEGGNRIPAELQGKPIIALTPFKKEVSYAEATIPVAMPGVEADGVFTRADGIPLKIRGLVESSYPAAETVLAELTEETE